MDATLTEFSKLKDKEKQKDPASHIQQENEEKSDGLGQAKDRAQLTANSAMSVVQIALLKEVIVQGPEHNRYYLLTLILICLSLGLQIISGLIALLVGHLRMYYSQYKDDALDDCCEHICCCNVTCRRRAEPEDQHQARDNHGFMEEEEKKRETEDGELNLRDMPEHSHIHLGPSTGYSPMSDTGCCPCKLTTMLYDHYEYRILNAYDEWKRQAIDHESIAAESNVQLKYLADKVKTAKEQQQNLEINKDIYTEEEFTKACTRIQKILDEAEKDREELELIERRAVIARARGEVLWEKARAIRKYQILKRASFWQNTLNYIYYAVFVLNGFITGFGIVSGEGEGLTKSANTTKT